MKLRNKPICFKQWGEPKPSEFKVTASLLHPQGGFMFYRKEK